MHIGMQSYAAAAHLAARVYNEAAGALHLQLFASEPNKSVLLKKCSKKESLQDDLFCEKCGRTAQQRGRISLLFLPEKAVFRAGKSAARREREHTTGCTNPMFVLLRPFPCVLQH